MNIITSVTNPRIKWLVGLRRRSARDAEGVALIDGYDELTIALEAGADVRTVFCCESLVTDEPRLARRDQLAQRGFEVVMLSAAPFAKASYRESPDGWLAVVGKPDRRLDDLTLGAMPLVLVTESIEKPGNLGAILRTADAAGVDAVIAADPITDWANPNVIRASKGTVFSVPVASASVEETIAWLRRLGLKIVVATPDAAQLVTEVDLTGGVAVVVGAEHAGVSRNLHAAAVVSASIPMHGRINSLNVATSAAIVVYEALRQRALG